MLNAFLTFASVHPTVKLTLLNASGVHLILIGSDANFFLLQDVALQRIIVHILGHTMFCLK